MLKLGDQIKLSIEKLTFNGGRGLARFNGAVVFVPFTAPGDKVTATITKIKKRFIEAELHEIIEPSSLRTTPVCPVFGRCGGCSWQHLTYNSQLQTKLMLLGEFIKKVDPHVEVSEFLESPQQWHYRNRIQLHAEDGLYGYYSRKTNNLIPIKECPIADKDINENMALLYKEHLLKGHFKKKTSRFELTKGPKGRTHLITNQFTNNIRLFSQVNVAQNENLIKQVLNIINVINPKRIFDLYCGSGNFTFPIKDNNQKVSVSGVEMSSTSIKEAQKKALHLDADICFTHSTIEDFFKTHPGFTSEDLILIDPPRTGLSKSALEALAKKQPPSLIYISCNPATLTRDLTDLYKLSNLRIKTVIGFDMFPQTDHIESLVYLTSKSTK